MTAPLIVLNTYALTAPPQAFATAITLLVRRVEASGEPGVRSYRFFLDEAKDQARAVIEYDTPAAWIGHHEIAMDWPEMTAVHAVARLQEITFLGEVTPEIRTWLQGSALKATVTTGASYTAGFRRAYS